MNDRELDLALADALDEIERLRAIIARLTDEPDSVEVIDFADSTTTPLE